MVMVCKWYCSKDVNALAMKWYIYFFLSKFFGVVGHYFKWQNSLLPTVQKKARSFVGFCLSTLGKSTHSSNIWQHTAVKKWHKKVALTRSKKTEVFSLYVLVLDGTNTADTENYIAIQKIFLSKLGPPQKLIALKVPLNTFQHHHQNAYSGIKLTAYI